MGAASTFVGIEYNNYDNIFILLLRCCLLTSQLYYSSLYLPREFSSQLYFQRHSLAVDDVVVLELQGSQRGVG